jgi:NAD(P)-dependent dehydrogenase (short-subunit alcohol dehydrogenase family)
MSIQDKVIVITGAASGMGLETARLFASKGAKLSLADVQEKALKEIEEELQKSGAQVMSRVVDVSKRQSVEDWIAATVEKFGKLDGAANLAGVIGRQNNVARIEELDDDDWDFIFGVNTKGLMNCMRAEIPNFNDGGSIVNAASILGLMGSKKSAAYVASKHAVVGLTRAAAKELGERNIRVNCFCP